MNLLWGLLLLIGIAVGIATGESALINDSLLDGSKEAVTLCISMVGIMAFWTGLMEIARASGILAQLTQKLKFCFRILFPDLPPEHPVNEYIASNMLANILGLGWAATPMGIKAMQELAKIDAERHGGKSTGIASTEMCTFLIINISSLQLIPVNIIAYRSQYGSVQPTSIIGTAILATLISTVAGVLFSILARKLSDKKSQVKP